MDKTILVCDSGAILPADTKPLGDFLCVPLTIVNGKGEAVPDDGVAVTEAQMGKAVRDGERFKTGVAPIGVLMQKFEELSEKYDRIIYFPIGKALSGQFGQAKTLESEFPKLLVVDTNDACLSIAWLMADVRKHLNAGGSIKEVQQLADEKRELKCTYFTLQDVSGLVASGRISKFVGAIAGKVKLKPIIRFHREVERGGADIGLTRTIARMVKIAKNEMLTAGKKLRRLAIYAGLAERKYVQAALENVKEIFGREPTEPVATVPNVVLAHTLLNTIGIAVEVE